MLLDYYDARRQLLASLPAVSDSQVLPLTQAVGQVLAADVTASYDTPQFDNSAMDGYAIADPQAERLQFSLVGRIAAGDSAEGVQLQPGQAVRIFTGAPVPAGTSAVVPQEEIEAGDDMVTIAVRKE